MKGNIEKAKEKLVELLGKERVSDSPDVLYIYSQDMTENEPSFPDMVVIPQKREEVQEIVKIASEFKIPLVPFVTGNNVGGLTIPERGGIIVDMKRMKGIEVNEEEMYMVLEPGVTFGELRVHLERNHPSLIYSYPLAPPYTSVLMNALLDGLNNLSTRYGAMSEWIQGLEVVLSDGSVAKIGAPAVSTSWFSRAPLPDLSGLFISWQGTTGIVTKGALMLLPALPFRKRFLVLTHSYSSAYHLIMALSRKRAFDEIAGFSWVAGKTFFLREGTVKKSEDDPEFLLFVEMSGSSEEEVRVKEKIFNNALKEVEPARELEGPLDVELMVKFFPEYTKFSEFPTTLDFLLDRGGGLTWIGSYGPSKKWKEGAEGGSKVLEGFGFPPLLVARSMKEGHYQVLRFIIPFRRHEPEERKKVRECLKALAEFLLEIGYIPYKMPAWLAPLVWEKADPGYVELLKKIKKTMDPDGIMNPGKLGL